MKSLIHFVLCGALWTSLASASPKEETPCTEYSRLFQMLSLEIIGLANAQANLKFVNSSALSQNAAVLKCESSNKIKHTAWSEAGKTKLNFQQWRELSILDRLRLVVHEIAVMAGIERDGQYFRSNKLTALLTLHSKAFGNLISAKSVLRRDGTVTFINPFVMVEGRRMPIGFQAFADVDQAYFPLTKEERLGKYAYLRSTPPQSLDLHMEFCKLQRMTKPETQGLANTQYFSLRDDNQKLDPPVDVVPQNFEIAWIDQGQPKKTEKLYTRATGRVYVYETVTCEQIGGQP